MSKSLKLLFFLFFIQDTLSAQVKIDSFRRILPSFEKKEDSTLVNIYQQLALFHVNQFQNIDSTDFYTEKGLQLAIKLQYRKGMARGYMVKSAVLIERNQLADALQVLQKSYKIYTELGIDKEAGQALYSIGNVYQSVGDNEKALQFYIEGTKLLEKDKNNPALDASYINLANGFASLKKYSEAITYSRKAIAIAQKNKAIRREIIALVNLVGYFKSNKQLDSAIVCADDAMLKSQNIAFPLGEIRAKTVKMAVLIEQKKYIEAINTGNEVVLFAEKNKLNEYLSNGFCKMAVAADSLKNLPKALIFAQKALENAQKYPDPWDNQLNGQAECHSILYDIYKKQGNFRLSLWHFEQFKKLTDSLQTQEKTLRSTNLASFYEVEKKEQTLKELNHQNELQALALRQKNTMFWAAIASAALFFMLGFFFYRQKQFKAKQKADNLEQRLLRTRLDPHFWFNVMGSVQTMLLSGEENSRKAAQYITKIAAVMRQSLESSYQDLVSIEDEIAFIEKYLNIQQIQTNNKFSYVFNIDNQLNINEVLVPSMLLQPFAENAIQHGFSAIEKDGLITINIKKNENKALIINILDNGKGFSTSSEQQQNRHRSRALEITKERLHWLASKYKGQASINIVSDNQTKGTNVEIILPLIEVL